MSERRAASRAIPLLLTALLSGLPAANADEPLRVCLNEDLPPLSVHHRGQLSTYLRPMGSKVPSIYGGSADEPVQM